MPILIIPGIRTQLPWPKNVPKLIQSMKKYVGYARVDPKDKQSLQVNDFEKVPFCCNIFSENLTDYSTSKKV